jgi:hypothetical protein
VRTEQRGSGGWRFEGVLRALRHHQAAPGTIGRAAGCTRAMLCARSARHLHAPVTPYQAHCCCPWADTVTLVTTTSSPGLAFTARHLYSAEQSTGEQSLLPRSKAGPRVLQTSGAHQCCRRCFAHSFLKSALPCIGRSVGKGHVCLHLALNTWSQGSSLLWHTFAPGSLQWQTRRSWRG